MSQTYALLLGTDKVKDSRVPINDNFETLRSQFAGTAYPASPLEGQRFFNSSTHLEYVYNGSAWVSVSTAHAHDDRYYTETEVNTLLAGKSDTGHAHDDRYYTEAEITSLLAGKAAASHTHDDRYYTETEVNNLLAGKAAASHTHDDRYYTETEVNNLLAGKQAKLVSGTNIKTVNGSSILGSGNISISTGVTSVNGQTGAINTYTYGAIGTYVIAASLSQSEIGECSIGSVVAGSTLVVSTSANDVTTGLSGNSRLSNGNVTNYVSISVPGNYSKLNLSGTWQSMTRGYASQSTTVGSATITYVPLQLWVRIS